MERQPCRHVSMDAGDTPATTDSIAGMSIAIELQLLVSRERQTSCSGALYERRRCCLQIGGRSAVIDRRYKINVYYCNCAAASSLP